jgi:hypothetical protein
MNESTTDRFPWTAWLLTSAVTLILASAAWAWIDWRYVKELWSVESMVRANVYIFWSLSIGTLFVQYWVLRSQSAGRQTLGALSSAIGIALLWLMLISTVGDWYHVKIGGVLG